jgi:hypothetical protein
MSYLRNVIAGGLARRTAVADVKMRPVFGAVEMASALAVAASAIRF